MVFRPKPSRTRFTTYLDEVPERRRRGEFNISTAGHGTVAPRAARTRSFGVLVRKFFGLLRGFRSTLAIALTTLTISTALMLFPPYTAKLVFDCVLGEEPLPAWLSGLDLLPTEPAPLLTAIAVMLVVVTVLSTAISISGRWLTTRTTKRLQVRIRKRVFEHAVRLPLQRIYDLKSGGVASILREDAGSVADLIFGMIYNPWRAAIQLVGSLLILAVTDWRLLLGSILLIPTVFFTHRTWINRIRPFYRDIRLTRQGVDGQATEAFGGMRIVRTFGRQRSETGRFVWGNHFMARQELHVWWWTRTIEIIWEILIPTATAVLLLYGGRRVLSGALTTGELMMFLMYLTWLLGPLATLANSATQFQNSLSGLDRVLDLVEEEREMPARPTDVVINPATVQGALAVRSVSFHYPGTERYVLHDISFDAAAGHMIAFVGSSGAGKTTLCNLIARFYDPTDGAIELDGRDLRTIEVDSYRRLLGIVEQDIFLFDGTIAENIGYASRAATIDDVRQAAEIANADVFIRDFENGYDTLIGERGVRLSGGQRQRLAIARAVLADPRILILDEATSNLDTESERLIQQSLAVLMEGRTSFVIAHRLSTIMHADLIVVLQDGAVIETGTHDELMAASGRYRDMVRLQFDADDVVPVAPSS